MCDAFLLSQAGKITRHPAFFAKQLRALFWQHFLKIKLLKNKAAIRGSRKAAHIQVRNYCELFLYAIVCLRSLAIFLMTVVVHFFLPVVQLLFLVVIQDGSYLCHGVVMSGAQ